MITRKDLAELSRELDDRLVLSVYLARENEDPGKGPEWLRRLEVALGGLRSDIEGHAPAELPAFDAAAGWVMSSVESFGRILPHEGWCAFATEDRVWTVEGLPYRPREVVRWRMGPVLAPFVRALKGTRPAVLAVMSELHAGLYRFEGDDLSQRLELHAEWPPAEAGDVGISNRASRASGVRGVTGTDYAKRTRDENARRHRKHLDKALREMAGEEGIVVLGGTQKAISSVRKELGDAFTSRVAELPELAFDTPREELLTHVRLAASRLTEDRQHSLFELCADPRRGSRGWNETYRALAAGAVDQLLIARGMIEASPDDAERLVRLALAQGADVEEVGGELDLALTKESGGVAARLRFVPASLQA